MAIGSMVRAGVDTGLSQTMVPSTCYSRWMQVHDDMEQTVETTPLAGASYASSSIHWVRVPPGASKVILRAKYTKSATVTTSPVVRLIGAWPTSGNDIAEDGSFANDDTASFMRLDLADSDGTGITLTLVSSGTGLMVTNTYAYSDPTSITPIDLLGAKYIAVIPVTAANVNTGTVPCEALFMN